MPAELLKAVVPRLHSLKRELERKADSSPTPTLPEPIPFPTVPEPTHPLPPRYPNPSLSPRYPNPTSPTPTVPEPGTCAGWAEARAGGARRHPRAAAAAAAAVGLVRSRVGRTAKRLRVSAARSAAACPRQQRG